MRNLFLFILLALGIFSMYSQESRNSKSFDIKEFKINRATYLKKELNLTETEAAQFIPLSEELLDKRFELNKMVRDEKRILQKKTDKTNVDYQKLNDNLVDAQIKEAELQKEYYNKFKRVLPAEKIYKYRKVEMKFTRDEIGKYQHNRLSGEKRLERR